LKFIGEFVQEIDQKRPSLQQLFGLDDKRSKIESILKEELEHNWHSLPEPKNIFTEEYSIDSSSASRTLSNGVDFFIIRALMLGTGNYNKPKLRFEMVKGIRDYNVITGFERILRDLIEIEIVLDNIDDLPENSIVLIDGNLYGRFTHLLQELHLGGWYHLPLELLAAMQRLFDECEKRGIMLVGVSKFSKTRVLTTALLRPSYPSMSDPDFLDVGLLYNLKHGETGYTTPLMLGDYAIAKQITQLEDNPEKYRDRYFSRISQDRRDWATQVISDIPYSPAIVMFHMIPKKDAQPLRIDIPACSLGIRKKITDVRPFEFIEPSKVSDVVKQITSDFGGRDVYNALLYIVDREVRLGVKTVDTVYKSVLGKELGFPIEYDRSTRRFSN
jgi:NurA domain